MAGVANDVRGGDQGWATPPGVTNVTVWGSGLGFGAAALYSDGAWARTNAVPFNGGNAYAATAKDTEGRVSTESITVALPATVSFQYDLNGNLTNDGRRVFQYDYENQLTNVFVTYAWCVVSQPV
jgi:hypothetical protein